MAGAPRRLSRRCFVARLTAALPVVALTGLSACADATTVNPVTSATSSAARTGMSVSGSAASTAAAKAAPNSAAVQLTWGGEDGTFVAAGHKAEIDAFNKANPGIQVTYVPISAILSDAPAKLQTMIAGGDPPDFFEIGSSYYASVVAKGILLNLGSFIARSKDFNVGDFFPVVWQAFLYQNNPYAIPREGAPTVLFYNADMFQKAGLKLPPTNLKDADWWTNEVFLDSARKLTQQSGGQTSVFGYSAPQNAWQAFLFSFGGDILNADNTKCVFDSSASVTGFQWMQDAIYVDKVAPQPADLQKTAQNKLFEAGRAAMILTRRSQSGEFAQIIKGMTWKLGPFPKGPAGRISDMISNVVSVSAQTKHPAEAFTAASYMESTAGHLLRMQFAQQIGVPQRKSVVESQQFLNNIMSPAENQLVIDQIATAKFQPPMTPFWPQAGAAVSKAFGPLWTGQQKAQEVMTTLVPQVNAILSGQGG